MFYSYANVYVCTMETRQLTQGLCFQLKFNCRYYAGFQFLFPLIFVFTPYKNKTPITSLVQIDFFK